MVRLVIDGLRELVDDLQKLPTTLKSKANPVVRAHARGAFEEIRSGYPPRAHDELVSHLEMVESETTPGDYAVSMAVRNTSNLAFIFERGTAARHTKIGANRGVIPPGHVFEPIYLRWRRQMDDALKALVEQEGLTVTGQAEDPAK